MLVAHWHSNPAHLVTGRKCAFTGLSVRVLMEYNLALSLSPSKHGEPTNMKLNHKCRNVLT